MAGKSQSAMEYLTTYGWAILVIAVIFVLLFNLGIFNPNTFAPKAQPGACQITRPSGPETLVGAEQRGVCNNIMPQYVVQLKNFKTSNITLSNTGLTTGNSFTWVIWARWFGQGDASRSGVLIAQGWTAIESCPSASFEVQANSIPAVSNSVACTNANSASQWIQYAGTYNGVAATFYINGVNAGSVSVNGIISSGATVLGALPNTYGGYNGITFNGTIANVQFYNTSLSSNDISTLYYEGIGGAPFDIRNLVGWWPLNGNANDYSGNGYMGIPANIVYESNWYSNYQQP